MNIKSFVSLTNMAKTQEENIDLYLGSRLRTLSWLTDAFCPWRSFIMIPAEGMPTVFSFVIDAARIACDSWLDEENVYGNEGCEELSKLPLSTDKI